MARTVRRVDAAECRRCATYCDRVIAPASCVAAGCTFLYTYDDPLSGRRYMGCLQKVFATEMAQEVIEKRAFEGGAYQTRGGGTIANLRIGYQTMGRLNAEGTNAILICHALSGDSHVAGRMGLVGQRLQRAAVQPQLVVGVEHARGRGHQVRVHAQGPRALQQPYAVDRTAGAGEAHDQPLHAQACLPPSTCCSSPAWYISIMMSEPPTNSPST